MKSKSLFLAVVFFLFCTPAAAQPNRPAACDEEGVKPEKWLEGAVSYIATGAESESYLKLQNALDRRLFTENFWRRRDPAPDTSLNEFRQEFCERIAFADRKFSSGLPGWKTDRGRVYIVWGKPDKIEKGRAGFEQLAGVLFEKWSYKAVDGIGRGVEVFFVDPTETNEFRFPKEERERILRLLTPVGLTVTFSGSF